MYKLDTGISWIRDYKLKYCLCCGAHSYAQTNSTPITHSANKAITVVTVQVVKELRTEYSSGIASTCQRMSSALSATPATSIVALLSQARVATAQAGNSLTQMQQHAIIESLSSTLFNCLSDMLNNLAAALDSRVFVAATRGLWDFTGRDLLDFVENLQVLEDEAACWLLPSVIIQSLDRICRVFQRQH